MFIIALYTSHLLAYWLSAVYYDKQLTVPTSKTIAEVAPTVLFNQMALTPVLLPLFQVITDAQPLWISLWRCITDFVAILLLFDVGFALFHYAAHRCCMRAHRKHHELKIPHPAGALYASPIEHLFVYMLPLPLACAAIRYVVGDVSLVSLWLFVAIGSANTVQAHTPGTDHARHHFTGRHPFGNWPYWTDHILFTLRKCI